MHFPGLEEKCERGDQVFTFPVAEKALIAKVSVCWRMPNFAKTCDTIWFSKLDQFQLSALKSFKITYMICWTHWRNFWHVNLLDFNKLPDGYIIAQDFFGNGRKKKKKNLYQVNYVIPTSDLNQFFIINWSHMLLEVNIVNI
mgnify:CR=1 FL=1